MAMSAEQVVVEADLVAGRLRCPVCDGPLAPWGFARERTVRLLHQTRLLRPRRACCRRCQQTHVLLEAWALACGSVFDLSADHQLVCGSPLVQAVDAVGRMARACRLRLKLTASPWELAVVLTGLLHGPGRDPPGF
jgi:hypothetical protein